MAAEVVFSIWDKPPRSEGLPARTALSWDRALGATAAACGEARCFGLEPFAVRVNECLENGVEIETLVAMACVRCGTGGDGLSRAIACPQVFPPFVPCCSAPATRRYNSYVFRCFQFHRGLRKLVFSPKPHSLLFFNYLFSCCGSCDNTMLAKISPAVALPCRIGACYSQRERNRDADHVLKGKWQSKY